VGRVLERLTVLQKLLVGFIEVRVFALVLKGKVILIPHIREAIAAGYPGFYIQRGTEAQMTLFY
jgi:hypothetical protein